jgi:hypothetical protein
MNADQILKLLAEKHAGDIFVPECKNGPTWGGTHFRLDAWVMNRSWSRMCMTGYEIKVTRSDFLHDQKLQTYLPLCHQLYMVAPKGIVHDNELPAEIGLMEVASTGNRLLTRKKAPHRTIDPPSELLIYILMCRSKIGEWYNFESVTEQWKRWLGKRDEDKELGYMVARKIRERAEQLENENIKLKKENELLQNIKTEMTKLGLSIGWHQAWDIKRRREELERAVPESLLTNLNALKRDCAEMLQELQKLKAA